MSDPSIAVVYHANCTDGFGAALAAHSNLHNLAEYLPFNYSTPVDQLLGKKYEKVYVLDFCFNPLDMATLSREVGSVIVLDHHKTSAQSWAEIKPPSNVELNFDMNKSGALLAWEYFQPQASVPKLIQHISDRDLWKFEMEGTDDLHTYLSSIEKDFDSWKTLLNVEQILDSKIKEGRMMNTLRDSQVKNVMDDYDKLITPISYFDPVLKKPVTGLAVNAHGIAISELGNDLAERSGTFSIVWKTDGINVIGSVRSVKDFDCSVFAKILGGGGHKNSCGFTTDLKRFLSLF